MKNNGTSDEFASPEEWRTVPSFPFLEASSNGRIRRVVARGKRLAVPRILGGSMSIPAPGRGPAYRVISVWLGGRKRLAYFHKMVCEAFHGPRPSATHGALHRDDDPLNNLPSNLRWGLPSENSADAVRNGKTTAGETNGRIRLSDRQAAEIRALVAVGFSKKGLARRLGVSDTAIRYTASGVRKATIR